MLVIALQQPQILRSRTLHYGRGGFMHCGRGVCMCVFLRETFGDSSRTYAQLYDEGFIYCCKTPTYSPSVLIPHVH